MVNQNICRSPPFPQLTWSGQILQTWLVNGEQKKFARNVETNPTFFVVNFCTSQSCCRISFQGKSTKWSYFFRVTKIRLIFRNLLMWSKEVRRYFMLSIFKLVSRVYRCMMLILSGRGGGSWKFAQIYVSQPANAFKKLANCINQKIKLKQSYFKRYAKNDFEPFSSQICDIEKSATSKSATVHVMIQQQFIPMQNVTFECTPNWDSELAYLCIVDFLYVLVMNYYWIHSVTKLFQALPYS
jgi:hypothetical protein